MGGDEAPEAEGHVVAGTDDSDDTEHEAVVEERKQREQAGGDASGEGEAADEDVVRHDFGRGLRFDAKDAFRPHLVLVEVGDGVGAEVLGEEHDAIVGADDCDDCAEGCGSDGDRRCQQDVGREAAEQARVSVGEEVPDAGGGDAIAGVDVVVGAADEAVEVLLQCARGGIRACRAEIGGGLAVKEAEIAEIGAAEGLNAAGFYLAEKRIETIPVILA